MTSEKTLLNKRSFFVENVVKCKCCGRSLPVRKRIKCPDCGKEVSITPAGNYNAHHRPDAWGLDGKCKGSRKPVEPNFLGGGI